MSAADPDDEKTITGPPTPGGRRAAAVDPDVATGLQAERMRARAASPLQPGHTLPAGTRLRDYEITGLIGEGGFGIVYLAWDHSLQRKVAVKEYMPASMAARVSATPPSATLASTWPVAGLRTSNVLPPGAARHCPSMNSESMVDACGPPVVPVRSAIVKSFSLCLSASNCRPQVSA